MAIGNHWAALLYCLGASACTNAGAIELATEVVDAPGATGTGFRDPTLATNGVRGGGESAQSLDVYSIPLDGYLVLGFANKLLEAWQGAVLAKIAVLVFISVFIQKRPQGMFAVKGRALES